MYASHVIPSLTVFTIDCVTTLKGWTIEHSGETVKGESVYAMAEVIVKQNVKDAPPVNIRGPHSTLVDGTTSAL
jgi:hypothetical protein